MKQFMESYCYDANGNLVKDSTGRAFVYSSYDLVTQVTLGSKTTTFDYGPGRERIRRFDSDSGNSTTITTLYLGGVEKIIKDNGSTLTEQWKRNIGGFLQITLDPNNSANDDSHYFIKDHLGSISLITDENGAVEQAMDFDPWGQRRDTSDWDGTITLTPFYKAALPITSKGFTGHEMVDEMNIIHMNGRIYDARIARFLQADPIIQDPKNTQSLNRYSYVVNNPLNATDPSGFFLDKIWKGIQKIVNFIPYTIMRALGPEVSSALVAIGSMFCGPWAPACAAAGQYHVARAFGASTGDALKAGAIAGASTWAFGQAKGWAGVDPNATAGIRVGINSYATTGQFVKLVAIHGAIGGVSAELQGGKFGHGFASAGFTKLLSPAISDIDSGVYLAGKDIGQAMVAAAVGGTISEATGGKFANGAIMAAYGNLYNQQGVSQMNGYDNHCGFSNPTQCSLVEVNGKRVWYSPGAAEQMAKANALNMTIGESEAYVGTDQAVTLITLACALCKPIQLAGATYSIYQLTTGNVGPAMGDLGAGVLRSSINAITPVPLRGANAIMRDYMSEAGGVIVEKATTND